MTMWLHPSNNNAMATTPSRYRFTADTLDQINALMEWYALDTSADAVRFAITRLYHETKKDMEKKIRKSEKSV